MEQNRRTCGSQQALTTGERFRGWIYFTVVMNTAIVAWMGVDLPWDKSRRRGTPLPMVKSHRQAGLLGSPGRRYSVR